MTTPMSGAHVLVMAKTQAAYETLTAQLAARTVRRVYLAVVHGRLEGSKGVIDRPIGRDPRLPRCQGSMSATIEPAE